jgi:capsular polysaccharide biosynthesis protein
MDNNINDNLDQQSSGFELSIFEILTLLRRNIKLIIALTLISGLLAYGYSKLLVAPTYQSSATVFIQPKVNQNQVNYTDLLTNQKLIDTYTQIAKSNLVMNQVYPSFVNEGLSKGDIVSAISVSSIKDTEIIKFTVVTEDPSLSAQITNKLVSVFIEKVNSIMQLDNLKIIDTAVRNSTPVGPATLRNGVIGALIGMMLAIGIIFLRYLLDNTFKSAQDVERYLGLPVLGEIHFND